MDTISVKRGNGDEARRQAVEILRAGGIVAYPTETFYALGAKYDDEEALERLFSLKGRSPDKAVSLIVGGREELEMVVSSPGSAGRALMEQFWPGPVTLILPAWPGLSRFITTGGKIAVRVPGKSFALSLARAAGFPITATSANPVDKPPASRAEKVREYFPAGIDLLVDGGRTPGRLASTVIDTTEKGIKILRHGAAIIDARDFEVV